MMTLCLHTLERTINFPWNKAYSLPSLHTHTKHPHITTPQSFHPCYPWQLNSSSISITWFLECFRHNDWKYNVLSYWILSFDMILSRFYHIIMHIKTIFFFMAKWLCGNITFSLFIHLLISRYLDLDCTQFFLISILPINGKYYEQNNVNIFHVLMF